MESTVAEPGLHPSINSYLLKKKKKKVKSEHQLWKELQWCQKSLSPLSFNVCLPVWFLYETSLYKNPVHLEHQTDQEECKVPGVLSS